MLLFPASLSMRFISLRNWVRHCVTTTVNAP